MKLRRRSWFVMTTVCSWLLLLLLLGVVAVARWPLDGWALALLCVSAIVATAGHSLGLVLLRLRPRGLRALTALVLGQLGALLPLPLLGSDIWHLSVLLALVVGMQLLLLGDLIRIEGLVAIVLLSAALLVLIELLGPAGRPHLFPGTVVPLVLLGAGLLLAGLVALAWFVRLRHEDLNIATQLTLVFTPLAVGAIALITLLLIVQSRSNQMHAVGINYQVQAEISGERVGNALELQLMALQRLAREPAVLSALETSNKEYEEAIAPSLLLEQQQRLWDDPAHHEALAEEVRTQAPLALEELIRFRGLNSSHSDIRLTNAFGALVAVQGERTARYDLSTEEWWQRSWNNGQGRFSITDVRIDPKTGSGTVRLSVGVSGQLGVGLIGVISSEYSLAAIQQDVAMAQLPSSGELLLMDASGTLMGVPPHTQQRIGSVFADARALSSELQLYASGWKLARNAEELPVILAYAPLRTSSRVNLDAIQSLGWHLVVRDLEERALADVNRSYKVAVLLCLLATLLVSQAAAIVARRLARPISDLTVTADAIQAGDINQRASPRGARELRTLAEAFNTLTSQQQTLIAALQTQLADEITIARHIQTSLLPEPPQYPGLDIAACSMPAYEVGGDFYGFYALPVNELNPEGGYAIAVGDVSGKGITAALLMAVVSSALAAKANFVPTPTQMFTELNSFLYPRTRRSKMNAAAIYLKLVERASGWEVSISNAGMIAPLLRYNNCCDYLDLGGLPLGVVREYTASSYTQLLSSGAWLVLCSDGIIEAMNERREMYSLERLHALVAASTARSAHQLQQQILDDIHTFVGQTEQHDDMTLIVMCVQPTPGAGSSG